MANDIVQNKMKAIKEQRRQATAQLKSLALIRPQMDEMEKSVVASAKLHGLDAQDITRRQQVEVMILSTKKDVLKCSPTQDCYQICVDITFPLARDHQAFQKKIPMWRDKGDSRPFSEEEIIRALVFRGLQVYLD